MTQHKKGNWKLRIFRNRARLWVGNRTWYWYIILVHLNLICIKLGL